MSKLVPSPGIELNAWGAIHTTHNATPVASTWTPEEREKLARNDARISPYPRWWSVLARGFLAGFEVAALVYTVTSLGRQLSDLNDDDDYYYLGRKYRGMGSGYYNTALRFIGISLAVDGLAFLTAVVKNYYGRKGLLWMFACLWDTALGIWGVVTAILYYDNTGLVSVEGPKYAVRAMMLAIAIIHLVCMVGGFAGCCLALQRE